MSKEPKTEEEIIRAELTKWGRKTYRSRGEALALQELRRKHRAEFLDTLHRWMDTQEPALQEGIRIRLKDILSNPQATLRVLYGIQCRKERAAQRRREKNARK